MSSVTPYKSVKLFKLSDILASLIVWFSFCARRFHSKIKLMVEVSISDTCAKSIIVFALKPKLLLAFNNDETVPMTTSPLIFQRLSVCVICVNSVAYCAAVFCEAAFFAAAALFLSPSFLIRLSMPF